MPQDKHKASARDPAEGPTVQRIAEKCPLGSRGPQPGMNPISFHSCRVSDRMDLFLPGFA
ncbi:MAG: hypothetical protein CMJ81_01300 [Planctomycetaceae bacterium]|nr:hypothetical protein [Planctomycetaceae bacterium]